MTTTKQWRVLVDQIHGTDFMVSFDGELLTAQEKAARKFVVDAHKNGFIMSPSGDVIPMSNIKSLVAREYEPITTPNPAGVGAKTASKYGGGSHRINRKS